jgi:hypothetical protein
MPVEFGDLPGGASVERKWEQEAKELRANPGQWGRITTKKSQSQATNLRTNIRKGILVAFRPPAAFEVVTRGADVWARYVGEDGEHK